jgi:hypothetical protein
MGDRLSVPFSVARHTTCGLLLAACGACASSPGSRAIRAAAAGEALQPDSVIVRVANHFPHALTVYLVRTDGQTSLGEVAAGGEARYPILAANVVPTGVAFAVTPPASNESMRTAHVAVQPGQIVRFEIAPRLIDSRVIVRWPPRCETCADPLHPPGSRRSP